MNCAKVLAPTRQFQFSKEHTDYSRAAHRNRSDHPTSAQNHAWEHYAAVSHVWADDGQIDLIDFIIKAINKHQVNTPTSAWIDTLCIDQADGSAEAFWLPRVGDIYARASRMFLALPGI